MDAIELFKADGKPADVWHCGKCRIVARTQEEAERCCKRTLCSCGAECEKYYTSCRACQYRARIELEKGRFENAEKVTEWPGMIYLDGFANDGYCADVDELEYYINDAEAEAEEAGEKFERPLYAWTCDGRPVCVLDYDTIIEDATQDAYEDFDSDDLEGDAELKAALEAFNEKNKERLVWEPNLKRAIILQPRAKDENDPSSATGRDKPNA